MSGTFLDDIRRRQAQRAKAAGQKAAAKVVASTAEEDEGEPEKKGLLERAVRGVTPGFAEDAVLETGSLVGKAFDLGNKYVTRPVLGATSRYGSHIGQGDPITNLAENLVTHPLTALPPVFLGKAALDRGFGQLFGDDEVADREMRKGSFTDSFNKNFDNPIERMVVEMVADPTNLIGVGLAGKVAKAPKVYNTVAKLAGARNAERFVKGAVEGEEMLDAAQALPITLPLKGAKAVISKSPLLQRSVSAIGRGNQAVLRSSVRQLGRLGRLDPEGKLAGESEETIITSLTSRLGQSEDDANQFVTSLPDAKLGRIAENDRLPEPLRPLVTQELEQRGLVKDGQRTGKLTAYMQLDRVADQRQLSLDARRLLFDISDIFATAAHNFSPDRFPTIDNAYDEIGAATVQTSRAGDFSPSSTQVAGDKTVRGVYQPGTGYALFTPLMDATTPVHEILGHMLRYSLNDEEAAALAARMGDELDNKPFEERFAEGIENFLRTGDINQFPEQFRSVIERLRQHTGEEYRQKVPAGQLDTRTAETVTSALNGPEFGARDELTQVAPTAQNQPALPGFISGQPAQTSEEAAEEAINPNLQRLKERRAGQQQLPGVSNRPNTRNMQPAGLVDLNRTIPAKEAGKKAAATNGVRPNGRVRNADEIAALQSRVESIEIRLNSAATPNEIIRLRSEQRELNERITELEGRPVLPNGAVATAPTTTVTINPNGSARPSNVRQPSAEDLERINNGSGVFNENLYTEDEVVHLNEMIDQIGTEMENLREAGYGRGDISQSDLDDMQARLDDLQVKLDDERAFAQADREEAQLRIDELRSKLEEVTPKLDEANARIQTLEDQRNELSTLLDTNLKSESRRMWAERKLSEVEAEIATLRGGIEGGDPNLAGGAGNSLSNGSGEGNLQRRTVAERAARRRGVDAYDAIEPSETKARFDEIVASGTVPEVEETFYERVKNAIRKNSHQSGARKPTDKYKQGSVIKGQTLDGANRKITVSDIRALTGAPDDETVVQALAKLKIENPDAFGEMNLMGQITPAQDEKGNVLFQQAEDLDGQIDYTEDNPNFTLASQSPQKAALVYYNGGITAEEAADFGVTKDVLVQDGASAKTINDFLKATAGYTPKVQATPPSPPKVPDGESNAVLSNKGVLWDLGTKTKWITADKGSTLQKESVDAAGVVQFDNVASTSIAEYPEWSIQQIGDGDYYLITPDGETFGFTVSGGKVTQAPPSGEYVKYASDSQATTPPAPPPYTPGTTPKWNEPPPEPFATSVKNYGDLSYNYYLKSPEKIVTTPQHLVDSAKGNVWDELPDTLTNSDYYNLPLRSQNTLDDFGYKMLQDKEMYNDGGKINWAVRHYTSSGYDQLNSVARGLTGVGGQYIRSGVSFTDDDWKTLARVMDEYISAREPIDHAVTTFRGVKLYDKQAQDFVDQMVPGFRFSEDGFTSISTSFETADKIFSGSAPQKTMFRVELPAGSKAAFGFPDEKELILPRGGVFEVKKVARSTDQFGVPFRVVDVKYVGSPKTGEVGIDETLNSPSIVGTPSKFKDPLFQSTDTQHTNLFSSQDPFGSGRTNGPSVNDTPISTPDEGQLSQLHRDDPTSVAVNRIAQMAGIQPGSDGETFVGGKLTEIVGENPKHFQALDLTYPKAAEGFAESMRLAEAGDLEAAEEKIFSTLDEMNLTQYRLGREHPRWAAFKKFISNTPEEKASTFVGRDRRATTAAEHEIDLLREASQNPKIQKFQKDYNTAVDNVADVLADMHAAGKPVVAEIGDGTSISEVLLAWEVAEGAQKETLGSYLKLATGKDPEKLKLKDLKKISQNDAYAEGVVFRYHQEYAKKHNIKVKEQSEFTKALGSAAKMWREQALLSVRYHTVNALDMGVRSVIYGINPTVGTEKNSSKWIAATGEDIPDDIIVRQSAIVDGEERMRGSDMMLGTKDPEVSKLPVIGKPAGRLVQANRNLGALVENTARTSAWMTGMRNHLNDVVVPRFKNELTRVLGDTPEAADIARELEVVEGAVSRQRMFEMISERGYSVDQANELATVWKRGTSEASSEGRNLAKKLHFDYSADTRVIEEKLQLFAILPFHYWATRNIPFYLDTLAENPELARLWQTYDQISDENREEGGLTQRFNGMIPVDVPLLDVLFGEGTGYFNPLVALSITDQVKPRYTPEDATPFAEVLNEAGRVGLSPAPWIVTPLTILGAYGDRADAPDTLRHSRLIGTAVDAATSALGIPDVTRAPIRSTVDAAQERVTGKEKFSLTGDAYKDSRVTKKLAELSIRETGDANNPDYVAAMADPEHPLFRRALAEVNKEMLLEQLYGFVSPVPMKYLAQEEADIRLSRKQLADQYGGIRAIPDDVYSQLRESGDVSTGYFKSGGDARGRQVFAGFDRSRGLQKNWDVLERRRINEELPFYAQYIAWSNAQPAGADTSVDAFVKAT